MSLRYKVLKNLETAREGTQEPQSREFPTAANQETNSKNHMRKDTRGTQSDRNPAGSEIPFGNSSGPKSGVKDAGDKGDNDNEGG